LATFFRQSSSQVNVGLGSTAAVGSGASVSGLSPTSGRTRRPLECLKRSQADSLRRPALPSCRPRARDERWSGHKAACTIWANERVVLARLIALQNKPRISVSSPARS